MAKMRVLQLATSLSGGAGIAAKRFHESLVDAGVDSALLSREIGASLSPNIRQIDVSAAGNVYSSVSTLFQTKLVQKGNLLVTPNSVETIRINEALLHNYDLIHVHAFYNLLSLKSFSKLSNLKIPVIVTMHDERLFTGGCHYSLGCKNFQSSCKSCPQVQAWARSAVLQSQERADRIMKNFKNLNLIAPSSWLANEARKSSIFRNQEVSVIPNPVPQIIFDANAKRSEDKVFRIGFSSINLDNPYKGLSLLVKALNIIAAKKQMPVFDFRVFGKGEVIGLSEKILFSQKLLSADNEIADELAKVDLLAIPSLQDNLPSVLTEGLAAGCRVVCSRTGGISEIADSMNMPTFEVGDHLKLAELIENEIRSRLKMTESQLQLRLAFSPSVVASQAIALYEKALS